MVIEMADKIPQSKCDVVEMKKNADFIYNMMGSKLL